MKQKLAYRTFTVFVSLRNKNKSLSSIKFKSILISWSIITMEILLLIPKQVALENQNTFLSTSSWKIEMFRNLSRFTIWVNARTNIEVKINVKIRLQQTEWEFTCVKIQWMSHQRQWQIDNRKKYTLILPASWGNKID